MSEKALAGSQIPLFDKDMFPSQLKEPEQLLMLEVFSCLSRQKSTKLEMGYDTMPWKRRHALTKAATFHPERSIDAVMKAFIDYSGGDRRPVVFDLFIGMYLRRAEDRPAKLDKFLTGIKLKVASAHIPTLADKALAQ